MNRYSLLFIVAFVYVSFNVNAQDTLYFQNGSIEIGNIVDIDSSKQKLAFRGEKETIRVLLFSVITRIGFDDTLISDNNFFNAQKELITDAPKVELYQTRDFFLFKEAKYRYGKWIIQFDLLSPFVSRPYTYPNNSSIGIGSEYFFTENISISLMGRFGINNQSFSTDTLAPYYYYQNADTPEVKSEIEISARLYPIKERILIPYFAPTISFGNLIYYHRKNFTRYIDQSPDNYEAFNSILLDRRNDSYFEWGGAIGFLINVTRHVNLSAQLVILSSNATRSSAEGYDAYNDESYRRSYVYDNKFRQVYGSGQVFLVYRFGGMLKED